MGYVIYHKESTRIAGKTYKTHAAAKAALTRMGKGLIEDENHPKFRYGIAEVDYFEEHIERQVERVNMITGKKYMEPVNTPGYMSPSSEAYWSA